MDRKNLIVKECKDCGAEFEISEGEIGWYARKGWEIPRRCKACREIARNKRTKGGEQQ